MGFRLVPISTTLIFNPLEFKGNYGDTSNNMKLVHWQLMGGLLYLVHPNITIWQLKFELSESVAVCEIFSVKKWHDAENQVRGRSRSLKMAPFDRPYATFHWSAIVNIALSCTIFECFLTLNNIVTLKSGLEVTQCN